MKTINFKLIPFAIATVIVMGSCSNEFLEVEPKGTSLESNYYQNQEQAFAGLVSVYDIMRKNSGGFENMITMMNAGSDDHFAGGGGASLGTNGVYWGPGAGGGARMTRRLGWPQRIGWRLALGFGVLVALMLVALALPGARGMASEGETPVARVYPKYPAAPDKQTEAEAEAMFAAFA